MTKNARLATILSQERAELLKRYDPSNDSVKGLAQLFEDAAMALREADRQASALRKHAKALSKISAMCGPANSMGVSMYDIDPHPDVVIEQVQRALLAQGER